MKRKQGSGSKNGFSVLLLDVLFVTFGLLLLIALLFQNQKTLASIIDALR